METCVDHKVSPRKYRQPTVPNPMGVAKPALGLIETAKMAGRMPARELYPGTWLWAEASHSACDALNRTATTANPESKLPYGINVV